MNEMEIRFYALLTHLSRPYKSKTMIQYETFKNGDITLYLGDCLDVIPFIPTVDCVVTDPAYRVIGGGNSTGARRTGGMLTANDGKIFDHNDTDVCEWMPAIFNLMRDPSHAYIMTNFLNLQKMLNAGDGAGFKFHNLLTWNKNTVTPNRWYMKDLEYIIFARKGAAFAIHNKSAKTSQPFPNPRNKIHPTQKPVELMEVFIANSTDEEDIVFDPFMGVATTGVAALRSNTRFIGVEKAPVYFKLACEQIQGAIRA